MSKSKLSKTRTFKNKYEGQDNEVEKIGPRLFLLSFVKNNLAIKKKKKPTNILELPWVPLFIFDFEQNFEINGKYV